MRSAATSQPVFMIKIHKTRELYIHSYKIYNNIILYYPYNRYVIGSGHHNSTCVCVCRICRSCLYHTASPHNVYAIIILLFIILCNSSFIRVYQCSHAYLSYVRIFFPLVPELFNPVSEKPDPKFT